LADSSLPGMDEEEYSEDKDQDAEYEEDDGMDVDAGFDEQAKQPQLFGASSRLKPSRTGVNRGSLINPSPGTTYNALRSSRRARTSAPNPPHQIMGQPKSPWKQKDLAVSEIARSLAARRDNATVDEPDDLILTTEDIMTRVYSEVEDKDRHDPRSKTVLSIAVDQLVASWQEHANADDISSADENINAIGPSENASPLAKATFLSSLLLHLHHPIRVKVNEATFSQSRSGLGRNIRGEQSRPGSFPEVIIAWLETDHDTLEDAGINLLNYAPNPTAHSSYWDIILTLALRGHVMEIINIFKQSDFQHAKSAIDDGEAYSGYRGYQLQIITMVVNRARKILQACPGVMYDDWDVKGRDWDVFRRQVDAGLEDLILVAEGPEQATDESESNFQADHFGISGGNRDGLSISQSSRRASSKVPWTIYQSLKDLYGVLLGSASEILAYSQDWAEATMALTLWWDGDDDGEITFEESVSRNRNFKQSRSQAPRFVDLNTEAAYVRRLGYAFDRVTEGSEEANLQIDSMNATEVGLAAIFENDVEAVLGLLQSWSLPIAAAVAEIATLGGWLEASTGTDLMGEFNESDLIVLGSQKHDKKITKDSVLEVYSTGLFLKGTLRSEEDHTEVEGWQLAFEILPRLSNRSQMEFKINDFLKEFPLESQEMADKLMSALEGLGLDKAAQQVSEVTLSNIILSISNLTSSRCTPIM
jgi:hypothetical protein